MRYFPAEGHGGLGHVAGEDVQAAALAAGQQHGDALFFHVFSNSFACCFFSGSGERPLAPQEHRTEGRDPDGGGAFLSMGGHGLHHHRLSIAETVAAVCGVIGIEHGHIPPVGRHAHPIVRIGVGREVHRAHKVAALLVPAQKHHHVVVVVVRHQPFKARPVEVDLPQSRRLFIKGVDLPEELAGASDSLVGPAGTSPAARRSPTRATGRAPPP